MFRNLLTGAVALASLTVFSSCAFAVTDLTPPDAGGQIFFNASSTGIRDIFQFSSSEAFDTVASLSISDVHKAYGPGVFELIGISGTETVKPVYSAGAWTASITENRLSAGTYSVELTGTVSGRGPIAPVVSVATAGVPELSTWAMLGLGFAGLCFIGSRKREGARIAM